MTDRTRSDAFLRSVGPRKLTDDEHRTYVRLCIEEGSLGTGDELQDRILKDLRREREDNPPRRNG